MSFVRRVDAVGSLASAGLPESAEKELRSFLKSAGAKPTGALFLSGEHAKASVGAVAHELGRGLFRVDLNVVVSERIRETEKNLDRAFAAGEGQGAILLFDEADALFDKRSSVRYGQENEEKTEANYLLKKVEKYSGMVIVTTKAPVKVEGCPFCRFVALDAV
jgi:hypothetical protein